MQIPWYVAAIGAALVWGVHYPLVDHALKKLSLVSVLLLTALPVFVLAFFFHRTLAADYAVWTTLDTGPKARALALALTSLRGVGIVVPVDCRQERHARESDCRLLRWHESA